jgi:hypothetical protein
MVASHERSAWRYVFRFSCVLALMLTVCSPSDVAEIPLEIARCCGMVRIFLSFCVTAVALPCVGYGWFSGKIFDFRVCSPWTWTLC